VEVPYVEHLCATGFDPFFLGQCLTLRTMAIAAGVVRGVLVSTLNAHVHVAAEDLGAALGDVRQDTLLCHREPLDRLELGAMSAHDVRDVEAPSPWGAGH
jgi:hypothetical protein